MNFIKYIAGSGKVVSQGNAPDLETVAMQAGEGEVAIAVDMLPGAGQWVVSLEERNSETIYQIEAIAKPDTAE